MFLMSIQKLSISAILLSILLLNACVPARQFEDLQKKEKSCQEQNKLLRSDNEQLNIRNTELASQVEELRKNVTELSRDTSEQGRSYRRLNDLYGELTKSYDKLLANNEKLLAGNTEETRRLISQLSQIREELQAKEDKIKKDSLALHDRESRVNELQSSLKEKEQKVKELQDILNKGDSTVNALRKVVSDALLGFQGNGLSVNVKDGRVYVSMEERLLFASGSTVIEKKGEEALRELGRVLEKNKEINILVEGHTDNVPISGTLSSGAKDNWELSVLRATSVVKIILNSGSIDPTRLTATGRGQFMPVDPANTADARRKNRRTEIILSPKLDELMKTLEQINKIK
ncbi:MAG: flagellar motor protein MotB [Bacteroidetes bacterium]|nr:MAG: flagellar motor protein MotB [Bacteroidota bacterium]REK04839.1 MAG: flagellar motor protein MotB [Bacteroidota bacterium]REK36311.1 MAG: flagellar motor protein MotB [Bacteroidota bacterium]REK51023.1 MAG: flagellar motor protein MotB [Bacteroidota bacterium]